MSRHLRMWAVALVGGVWGIAAGAGDQPMSEAELEARWRAAAVQVRNCFAEWDGVVYCCATYDPKYANSNHADPRQWTRDNTTTLEFDGPRQDWIKPETLVPPTPEVDAHCKTLPSFAVGHYGTVFSGTIEAVKPGTGFVLRDVKLIDEEATQAAFEADQAVYDKWLAGLREKLLQENYNPRKSKDARVRGPGWEGYVAKRKEAMANRYSERSRLVKLQDAVAGRRILIRGPVDSAMMPGRVWNGQRTPIAIVGFADDPLEEGKTVLAAVVADQFRRGISVDQLAEVLANLKISRADFVAKVEAANQADRATANMQVLASLGFKVPKIDKPQPKAEAAPPPEPKPRRFDEFVR